MDGNVQNVEEDGNGFFITGINTHGAEGEMAKEEAMDAIEEIPDPADKYRHVAVVDCSKAFSNQEVSVSQINRFNHILFLFTNLFIFFEFLVRTYI